MSGSIEVTDHRPQKSITVTRTVNNPVVSEDPTANIVVVEDAQVNTVLYNDKINQSTFVNIPGYVFDQLSPSLEWVIPHNLSFKPNVTVINGSGEVVHGEVQYTGAQEITIRFTSPFTGQVYLS
jgi:hypothetical protein